MSKRQKLAPIFERASKKAKVEEDEESSEKSETDTEPREWKFVSWNVAGSRSWVKKNGHLLVEKENADVIFLGETKCQELPGEIKKTFTGYHMTLADSKVKKGGYAGVALLSKKKPIKVWKGIGDSRFDDEGRLIIAEYPRFFFVGAYVPNSGQGLVNLEKRGIWENLMREKLKGLIEKKPIIYGGDLNVAHEEIDLANPKSNANKTAGFTDQEREDMTKMLDECELTDTFRKIHGDKVAYTFWSYRGGARTRNIGWRLDYFLVSNKVADDVIETFVVDDEKQTSDHAPIVLKVTI